MEQIEWRISSHKSPQELYYIFWGKRNYISVDDMVCVLFPIGEVMYGFATSIYGFCGRSIWSHAVGLMQHEFGER